MTKRPNVSWRFGLVAALELATLYYLPELAKWRSDTRSIWQSFVVLAVSLACLVILVPVLFRSDLENKIWAVLLGLFPLLIFVNALYTGAVGLGR